MVQYYRDMWTRRSQLLAPTTEAASGPKGTNILWNNVLKESLKELTHLLSDETLLNYIDWKFPETVYTYASAKHLGAVSSQNNKPIKFFSVILSKPKHNYTTIEKELLLIVEFRKKSQVILFSYEINIIIIS